MAGMLNLMNRLGGEIQKNGLRNTYYKVKEKRAKNLELKDYGQKRLQELPTAEELEMQRNCTFKKDIVFSIVVPTFHTPEVFLRQMTESVLGQTFCHVELCIADGSTTDCVEKIIREYQSSDGRIKYQRLAENKGISENTNAGLGMATGDYVGLLDHDDLLEPHALYEMRRAIERMPKADVLYSDEDKVSFDLTHYFEPHYKPDFNPDLLRSNNYFCHFLVVSRTLLEKTGGFRKEFDGAQDYDLVLRLTEKAECIVHIPKVLYHWRSHEASTAANPMSKLYAYEAGKRAVEAHLKRCGEAAVVTDTRFFGFYQTTYEKMHDLSADFVVCSVKEKNPKKILKIFSRDFHRQTNGNVIYYDNGFNKFVIFSKDRKCTGDVVVFLDAGLEKLSAEGLMQLVRNCQRDGNGMAGGRILDRNGGLLEGRMEKDARGRLFYADQGLPKGFTGYFHKAVLQQNTEGVSYRLFAVRRSLLDAWQPEKDASGEELMQQLCEFVRASGYRISYVPAAEAVLRK